MMTIDELRDKLDNKARLIGLDIGTKHIGIAICDDKRKIATPFKTLDYINMSRLIDDLKIIIDENDIKGMIVGYPINLQKEKKIAMKKPQVLYYKEQLII